MDRQVLPPEVVRLAFGGRSRAVLRSAVPTMGDLGHYRDFYDEVAAAQLRDWLPPERSLVLEVSAPAGRYAPQIARAGHTVVVADLDTPVDQPVDAVVAEGGTFSGQLATEFAFARIHDLLRPGGRLLVCVQSLVLGLARLAEQERWAELADVPAADVVLIEAEDGSITRCFWPEELRSVLDGSGFDVEWVRPRTALSQHSVDRALAANPGVLPTLVRTELALAREREGESVGIHLVASARRR